MLRGTWFVPTEVSLVFFKIKIYSLCLFTAIWTVFLFAKREIIREKLASEEQIYLGFIFVLIPAIFGARLWHVLTDFGLYRNSLSDIFAIWQGGLSIFGAIAGGLLGLYLFIRLVLPRVSQLRNGLAVLKIINIIMIFLPLGQAIGRFGNFFNQELYGPITNLPWGQFIDQLGEFHHPAFLYEQIGDLILFLILYLRFRKYRLDKNGYFLIYTAGYTIVRFVVEFFRLAPKFLLGLTFSQWVCLIVLVGVLLGMRYQIGRTKAKR
ncbi:MAG: prolipoprotein diacylglyceryl transferase [bacterium]